MFGWEFPPYNSGGLGVACKGIVGGLTAAGVDVTFVLPQKIDTGGALQRVRFADPTTRMSSSLAALYNPYLSPARYRMLQIKTKSGHPFTGSTLYEKVLWYASRAADIARSEPHDVVHAHDWLTYPAGIVASRESGKPLVVHVHATEFDRTGNGLPNPEVYAIEKMGLEAADRVIAVSEFTKKSIVENYGIDPNKVEVVHNVIEPPPAPTEPPAFVRELKKQGKHIVLFVGRLTLQKGPDYLVRVAKRVLPLRPDVHFVIAGAGEMEDQVRDQIKQAGLEKDFTFAGFVRGGQLSALYRSADIYMMPSVSEPFGLTALEALSFGLPSVISRQSGVAEVTRHVFKTDFWDVDEMASKILSVLEYPALKKTFSHEAPKEARRSRWQDAGHKLRKVYQNLVDRLSGALEKS